MALVSGRGAFKPPSGMGGNIMSVLDRDIDALKSLNLRNAIDATQLQRLFLQESIKGINALQRTVGSARDGRIAGGRQSQLLKFMLDIAQGSVQSQLGNIQLANLAGEGGGARDALRGLAAGLG